MGYKAMVTPSKKLQSLLLQLNPFYKKLTNHPLYQSFNTIHDLHIFMKSHAFKEVKSAAKRALHARIELWDDITANILNMQYNKQLA